MGCDDAPLTTLTKLADDGFLHHANRCR